VATRDRHPVIFPRKISRDTALKTAVQIIITVTRAGAKPDLKIADRWRPAGGCRR
jgi:hypothetical protein